MFGDSSFDLVYQFGLETIKSAIADQEAEKSAIERKITGYRKLEGLIKQFMAQQEKQKKEWAKRQKKFERDAKKRAPGYPLYGGIPGAPVAAPAQERRAG